MKPQIFTPEPTVPLLEAYLSAAQMLTDNKDLRHQWSVPFVMNYCCPSGGWLLLGFNSPALARARAQGGGVQTRGREGRRAARDQARLGLLRCRCVPLPAHCALRYAALALAAIDSLSLPTATAAAAVVRLLSIE